LVLFSAAEPVVDVPWTWDWGTYCESDGFDSASCAKAVAGASATAAMTASRARPPSRLVNFRIIVVLIGSGSIGLKGLPVSLP
jgi:hypothetical protein